MSLKGKTIGAKGIGPGLDPAVWKKLPEALFTNRAGNDRAPVKNSQYFQAKSASPLKVLSGYIPD